MEEEKQKRLKQYLDGTLDPGEREALEALVSSDPSWKDALRAELRLRSALHRSAREGLKAKADFSPAGRPRVLITRRTLLAVAAVALLGILGYFLVELPSAPPAPTALYDQYFSLPDIEQVRSGEDPAQPVWSEVVQAYDRGNWAEVRDRLQEQVAAGRPAHPQAPLILAIAWLELEDPDQALRTLQTISDPGDPYYFDALWYRVMIHLKLDQPEPAIPLLEELKTSRVYGGRAGELLDQLG